MLGVIREIFESEGASIRGDEDFFSVASTIPFVAVILCEQTAAEFMG